MAPVQNLLPGELLEDQLLVVVDDGSAASSVSSTVRSQRSFVATHCAAYVQRTAVSGAGGSQVAGSWLLLLRLERAVTATRDASAP